MIKAVSAAAGPAGMAVCALAAGLLIGIGWRSWAPAVALGTTVAGAIGLTIVFKAALAQPRPRWSKPWPPPTGTVSRPGTQRPRRPCGAVAWLCGIRMRSWRARTGIWAMAAMLAALVGMSRVYLGLHWATDMIGGWIFGLLWLAVVVIAWAAFARRPRPRRTRAGRPASGRHSPVSARCWTCRCRR